ncbi:sulfatase [Candidatus Hydrogenedentota bacterium]
MNTTRRAFLKTVGMTAVGAVLAPSFGVARERNPNPRKQPNILFIMTDQQRSTALGCADHPLLKTPNIDKIAASGLRFTNGYVNSPQCGPTRASLYTGRYVHNHGVRWNGVALSEHDSQNTVAQVLKRKGYRTACFGKMHIWGRTGFELGFGVERSDNYQLADQFRDIKKNRGKEPYWQAMQYPHWTGELKPDPENYHEVVMTDRAIAHMESSKDKPFFIWLSYHGPHPPYAAPEPYHSMFDPKDVPMPATPTKGVNDDPRALHKYITGRSRSGKMTEDNWRNLIAQYLASCAVIDDQVGRLLEKLDELGIADETIIVYTADHGDALGDHGLISKGMYCYDGVEKVPYIVSVPGMKTAGKTSDALVQSIDLPVTLLELTGARVPFGMEGKNLLPILDDAEREVNDTVYAELGHHPDRRVLMVRDKRYKYVYSTKRNNLPDGAEELFDMENDPHEFSNLVLKPEGREILEQMRFKMLEWRILASDPLPKEMGNVNPIWR